MRPCTKFGRAYPLSPLEGADPAGGSIVGQFLRAAFGYTATPELTTFVVWLAYVVIVLALYLRPIKRPAAPAPASASAPTPTASRESSS